MTAVAKYESTSALADASEVASYRAIIKRLPVTLRPALNGQLSEWETLFPFERKRVQEFMRGVESFDPASLDALFVPMRKLESKMGVESWNYSQAADTMENASHLARSAFYAEWRDEVKRIYAVVEAAAGASVPSPSVEPRIIVTIFPATLPYERAALWKRWQGRGIEIAIDGDPARIANLLFEGPASRLGFLAQRGTDEIPDQWLIDAGSTLAALPADPATTANLSYTGLSILRDRVLARVNTVPKDIGVTDRTLAAIRTESWAPWWPAELKDWPVLRRFVIDLYLSGNGALIFSNAFVEWAASEAIRRARPHVLIARFGLRTKPKPFTGIAIFENQHSINALPDVDDPQGSAIDASVLARYIFLAAQRYPEAATTAFVCIAESAQSAYLVLPETFKHGWTDSNSATPEQIAQWLLQFLSNQSRAHG